MMQFVLSRIFQLWVMVLLCLPSIVNALDVNDGVETFYKDPTYVHFVKATERFSILETNQDPYLESKLVIFTTLVLNRHPDFADKLLNDFASFNNSQQMIIYKSLLGADLKNQAHEITHKYQIKFEPIEALTVDKIKQIQFLDNITSNEQIYIQASTLDYCWAAFFATGDEIFIEKMVEFAKKHEQGTEVQMIPLQAFYWSANSLANQDPTIKDIIVKLSKKHHLEVLKS